MLFPLSETVIRGLHYDLVRYFPEASGHAGGYKTAPNNVVYYNHETGEKRTGLPRRTVQYALKTLSGRKFLQLLGKGAASRYQLVF